MNAVALILPWPPTVNHYWKHAAYKTKQGAAKAVTYVGEQGEAYRNAVRVLVLGERVPRGVLSGKLAVKAFAYPPDHRKRDLDNAWKAVLDSVKYAGVIEDDSEIDDLHIIRGGVFKGGRITLRIEEIPGEATTSKPFFEEEAA